MTRRRRRGGVGDGTGEIVVVDEADDVLCWVEANGAQSTIADENGNETRSGDGKA